MKKKRTSDFRSPDSAAIARRALVLSGVICRAALENYTDKDYRRDTAEQIHSWFDKLELWPFLEPCESEIIKSPLGKMPKQLMIRGTWFIEGLAVLAWVLKRADFPTHDSKVDPIGVTNALDFLDPCAKSLLDSPPQNI